MRLPRVRFTVRRMMVAVAWTAVLLWVVPFIPTRSQQESIRHASAEKYYQERCRDLQKVVEDLEERGEDATHSRNWAAWCAKKAVYHGEMKRRSTYSRCHPWATPSPESSEPDP